MISNTGSIPSFARKEARKLSSVWWPWGCLGIDYQADFLFVPALQALAGGGRGWGRGTPLSARGGPLSAKEGGRLHLGPWGARDQDCSSPAHSPDGQREDESGRLGPALLSFVAKDRDVPG